MARLCCLSLITSLDVPRGTAHAITRCTTTQTDPVACAHWHCIQAVFAKLTFDEALYYNMLSSSALTLSCISRAFNALRYCCHNPT